jgi:hypothetical protein
MSVPGNNDRTRGEVSSMFGGGGSRRLDGLTIDGWTDMLGALLLYRRLLRDMGHLSGVMGFAPRAAK